MKTGEFIPDKCNAGEEYTFHFDREKNSSAGRFFRKGYVEGSSQTAVLNVTKCHATDGAGVCQVVGFVSRDRRFVSLKTQ